MKAESDKPSSSAAAPMAVYSSAFSRTTTRMSLGLCAMSGGQLLLPFEPITKPANSDVKISGTSMAFSDPGDRRLSCFQRKSLDSTRNFVITKPVIYRKFVKNLFSSVHRRNYTRMNHFGQCVNERLFDNLHSRLNTEGHMEKTPAQLIADALDAAMKTANNGKPMTQAALSRLSGVPQPTISRTLSGKSVPEIQTLAPLVSVLGVRNVDLAASIEALLPEMENNQPALSLLTIQMFALGCKSCGKVTHKSLMELDMSDTTKCTCGATIAITDYYREPQLQVILKSLGGSGFALRKRHK